MKSCLVEYGGNVFDYFAGIPRGFAPGVILANLHLVSYHRFILDTLGEGVNIYGRFVDDVLLFSTFGQGEVKQATNEMRWSVRTELTGQGHEVVHLDVTLTSEPAGTVKWEMLAKPQNPYLYVPTCSNHHPSVFT